MNNSNYEKELQDSMARFAEINKNYQDMFQIGITSEMLGVKEVDYKNSRPNDDKQNEYEKEIWNAAIEEAAKLAQSSKGYPTPVSENIRKLKK